MRPLASPFGDFYSLFHLFKFSHCICSYSAALFNLSLSSLELEQLSDDAAAAGSREMCTVEISVTSYARKVKCFVQPPPLLAQEGREAACWVYFSPPPDLPFVFDPALNSGGSITAGELYSVSTHLTILSLSLPGHPTIQLADQFSTLSCKSFVMFRRRVSFAYLVQADGEFDDHMLQGAATILLSSSCNGAIRLHVQTATTPIASISLIAAPTLAAITSCSISSLSFLKCTPTLSFSWTTMCVS